MASVSRRADTTPPPHTAERQSPSSDVTAPRRAAAASLALFLALLATSALTWHHMFPRQQPLPAAIEPRSQENELSPLKWSADEVEHRQLAQMKPAVDLPSAPSDVAPDTRSVKGALRRARTGPCSAKMIVIDVYTASDFQKRLRYRPRQTVQLTIRRDLYLSRGLTFNGRFQCTRVVGWRPYRRMRIIYTKFDMPAISIINNRNFWMHRVFISAGNPKLKGAGVCKAPNFVLPFNVEVTCPGVYIINSFGIQITQSFVYGRIDVRRSLSVLLDHLLVRGPRVYLAKPKKDKGGYRYFDTRGLITVSECGVGAGLIPSGNIISNCDVGGAFELISLFQGAQGVTVRNNYLHNFDFTSVRLGADIFFVMSATLNRIVNNVIWNPPNYELSTDLADYTAMYFGTHFFDPGNYVSCNYIYNVFWCHYLDVGTSGVEIDGAVCVNTLATVKVNSGKFNKIRSVISVESQKYLTYYNIFTKQPNWISCFPTCCPSPLGNNYEAVRRAFYNTPLVNRRFPYMHIICNPIASVINGYSCNPPSQTKYTWKDTGYCSAFIYNNSDVTFYYRPQKIFGDFADNYDNSVSDPNIKANQSAWNSARSYNISINPGFLGGNTGPASKIRDFGVKRTSRVYKYDRNFKSCPRSRVGPTRVSPAVILPIYRQFWNIPEPGHFRAMLRFPNYKIYDRKLTVPIEKFTINRRSMYAPD